MCRHLPWFVGPVHYAYYIGVVLLVQLQLTPGLPTGPTVLVILQPNLVDHQLRAA